MKAFTAYDPNQGKALQTDDLELVEQSFTDPDASNQIRGAYVSAKMFYGMQAEMVNAIIAGGIKPEADNFTQLAEVIKSLRENASSESISLDGGGYKVLPGKDASQNTVLINAKEREDGSHAYEADGAAFAQISDGISLKTYRAIVGEADQPIVWMESQSIDSSGSVGVAQVISTPKTLSVGFSGDFTTIQEAWDSLQGKVITADITIRVANGDHVIDPIVLSKQPYAEFIKIVGNVTNPQSCILRLNSSSLSKTIVEFNNVDDLEFSGFKLIGVSGDSDFTGLKLSLSSVTSQSDSLVFEDIWLNMLVDNQSCLFAEGVQSRNANFVAAVQNGSRAILNNLKANSQNNKVDHSYALGCRDGSIEAVNIEASGFLNGIEAAHQSKIDVRGGNISDCKFGLYGYGSTIIAHDDTVISGCEYGIVSAGGARIYSQNASINTSINHGLFATEGGWIYSSGTVFAANTTDSNLAFNILGSDGSYIQN